MEFEQEKRLEELQDERVGREGTVAPWNLPTLSGEEEEKGTRKYSHASEEPIECARGDVEEGLSLSLKRGKSRLSISELAAADDQQRA